MKTYYVVLSNPEYTDDLNDFIPKKVKIKVAEKEEGMCTKVFVGDLSEYSNKFNDVSINSMNDLILFSVDRQIIDENGKNYTLNEFIIDICRSNYNGSGFRGASSFEAYLDNLEHNAHNTNDILRYNPEFNRNDYIEGPNGTLRNKVDGKTCVAHGEGAWDYFLRDSNEE